MKIQELTNEQRQNLNDYRTIFNIKHEDTVTKEELKTALEFFDIYTKTPLEIFAKGEKDEEF